MSGRFALGLAASGDRRPTTTRSMRRRRRRTVPDFGTDEPETPRRSRPASGDQAPLRPPVCGSRIRAVLPRGVTPRDDLSRCTLGADRHPVSATQFERELAACRGSRQRSAVPMRPTPRCSRLAPIVRRHRPRRIALPPSFRRSDHQAAEIGEGLSAARSCCAGRRGAVTALKRITAESKPVQGSSPGERGRLLVTEASIAMAGGLGLSSGCPTY